MSVREIRVAGRDALMLAIEEKGAERVKISYGTEAAAALYQGVGFHPTSTTTWYESPSFGNPLML